MLKLADDDDIPAISNLLNRAYRGPGSRLGWTTEADFISGDRCSPTMIRADLSSHPEAKFLKWVEPSSDELLGCVYLEPHPEGVWYLGSLAIDPARQAGGRGRQLLHGAEEWARVHSAQRLMMTVINVREELIAWYQRRGYSPTGETKLFPYGDARFGIPLRDDLSFIVLKKVLDHGDLG